MPFFRITGTAVKTHAQATFKHGEFPAALQAKIQLFLA